MSVIAHVLLISVIFLALCVPVAAVIGFRAGLYRSSLMGREDWRRIMGVALLITGNDRPELFDAMENVSVPSVVDMVVGDRSASEPEPTPPPIRKPSRGTAVGLGPISQADV
jgi:hypothetical protein